jgi:hypothetical protein
MKRLPKEQLAREKLAADAAHMREQAKLLPPGRIRDELLRKARQAEAAAQADEWANSSGLQPPDCEQRVLRS